eukprot:10408811-Ditylum_brightwellii.AAC.1
MSLIYALSQPPRETNWSKEAWFPRETILNELQPLEKDYKHFYCKPSTRKKTCITTVEKQ